MIRNSVPALAVAMLLSLAGSASADFSVDLTAEFSGATAPAGASPWLRATFADGAGGDAGDVFLHLEAVNLMGTEHVRGWYFNFDDSMDLGSLAISFESGNAVNDWEALTFLENDLKADGDGKYDFRFDWNNPSGGPNYFDADGDVTFRIHSTAAALTAEDFQFLSHPDGGHGPFVTAAHVQGIGDDGANSGWITGTYDGSPVPTPVPGAAALGLIGLALVGRTRRRFA